MWTIHCIHYCCFVPGPPAVPITNIETSGNYATFSWVPDLNFDSYELKYYTNFITESHDSPIYSHTHTLPNDADTLISNELMPGTMYKSDLAQYNGTYRGLDGDY